MSTPDKCPHCGAELRSYIDPTWKLYACGTSDTLPQTAHCRERAARIKAETAHAATKRELSNATDTLDLMRDEFQRIRARIVEKGCDETRLGNEILELCTRAMSGIIQRVSVFEQRDALKARVAELEGLPISDVYRQSARVLFPHVLSAGVKTLGQAMPAQSKYELEVAKACGKPAPHIAALYIHNNTPNT